jgi:NADP-dependent 3-hydroxy acid dehydrogenase YdfG
MVSLKDVKLSNSRIATSLPPHLVAVYIGATSGIGEASLKQFARYALQPRIYFLGRSQEAGDRIAGDLKKLNPQGEYIFVKADVSLIRVVDKVCADIKSKEKVVNLLFLCTGTLVRKGMYGFLVFSGD